MGSGSRSSQWDVGGRGSEDRGVEEATYAAFEITDVAEGGGWGSGVALQCLAKDRQENQSDQC